MRLRDWTGHAMTGCPLKFHKIIFGTPSQDAFGKRLSNNHKESVGKASTWDYYPFGHDSHYLRLQQEKSAASE